VTKFRVANRRVVPYLIVSNSDLAGFRNSNPAGARAGFGENFGSQNNTPDETCGVSNAVSCYKRHHSSVLLLGHCLVPVFEEVCGTAMNSVFLAGSIAILCNEMM